MSVAEMTRSDPDGLPPELRRAQDAVSLPEVQDMMQRLAAYNLGVFMPHQHDDATGGFTTLSPGTVQVESGLKVSFRPAADVDDPDRFVSVGWIWHGDGVHAAASCVMKCIKRPGDTMHYSGHEKE